MYPLLINQLSVSVALFTTFGVLVHDTQIDRAATTALALPAVIAAYGASEVASKYTDHTHVERVRLGANQHRMAPRANDDKKYLSGKRSVLTIHGSDYSWPSV